MYCDNNPTGHLNVSVFLHHVTAFFFNLLLPFFIFSNGSLFKYVLYIMGVQLKWYVYRSPKNRKTEITNPETRFF